MAWNEPGGNGNNNDPWGNRNNSGGPPDLDEVFKNLKKKLDGLLGNKGQGGGPSPRGGLPGGTLSGKGMGLLAAVLGVLWLLSGIYVIQPAEAGVVTQFGKHVTTTIPGPHWRIPWPVQAVERIDVEQIRSSMLAEQLILTQDENIVDIELSVQYNIKSADDYLFNVRNPDQTLEQVVESALREVIGSTNLESAYTTGRDAVAQSTRVILQEVLDSYNTGINVTAVSLEKAQPPPEVRAAFDDVVKAREDKERTISEAQGYSNEVLPRARGDAQRALEESEAYRTRVEQSALGESQRFLSLLAEYEKAPEVTRERLYLETMETVFSNTSKVMIDSKAGGGNSLMYLPIDKILEQNQNRNSEGSSSESNSSSSLANDSSRYADLPGETSLAPGRASLRSRERGAIR
ncbi:MAG: FtsH protease activity modulator HflK [Granulosicoccus sp.]